VDAQYGGFIMQRGAGMQQFSKPPGASGAFKFVHHAQD